MSRRHRLRECAVISWIALSHHTVERGRVGVCKGVGGAQYVSESFSSPVQPCRAVWIVARSAVDSVCPRIERLRIAAEDAWMVFDTALMSSLPPSSPREQAAEEKDRLATFLSSPELRAFSRPSCSLSCKSYFGVVGVNESERAIDLAFFHCRRPRKTCSGCKSRTSGCSPKRDNVNGKESS
eukprot:589063-Rhodomonas_salina.2